MNMIGPSLAASTMSLSLWLPFYLNILLLLIAIPAIRMLSDTGRSPMHSISDPDDIDEADPLLTERPSSPKYANAFETPTGAFQSILHAVRKLLRLVTGRRNFQLLLCSFFLTALASSDTKLLVQYISKRYEWTFAQVSSPLSLFE